MISFHENINHVFSIKRKQVTTRILTIIETRKLCTKGRTIFSTVNKHKTLLNIKHIGIRGN